MTMMMTESSTNTDGPKSPSQPFARGTSKYKAPAIGPNSVPRPPRTVWLTTAMLPDLLNVVESSVTRE